MAAKAGAPHALRVLTVTAASLLLWGCAEPNITDLEQFVAATRASSAGRPLEPLPEVRPYLPFLYEAQGERNPFAVARFLEGPDPDEQFAEDSGIRPDPDRPREILEAFSLGSLTMVGTFVQLDHETRWALIKAPDGIVHRVRTGNFMGTDHGRITNITEARIDLQEIVRDGDRGWRERDSFLSLAE